MENNKISCVFFAKRGDNFVETFRTEDPAEVYQRLAESLIAKKLNECRYIRSIKREQLYNGFIRITVTHDHGGKAIYIVNNV